MFLRPAKKNLPPRHKNFVLRRKICAQKRAKFAAERKILFCAAKFARKNAQNRANGFAYHAAKNAELRAKKILRRKLRNLRGSKNSRKWKPYQNTKIFVYLLTLSNK